MSYQPSEKQLAWYARGEEGMQLALQLIAEGELSVDAEGRIWRHKYRGQPCRPPRRTEHKNGNGRHGEGGYLMVHFHVDGKRQRVQAHRLAWTVLKGPIPPGMQINHLNGDKHDNRPGNMEVTDNCGNERHARASLGKRTTPPHRVVGSINAMKLSAAKTAEMHKLYSSGTPMRTLMKLFGISYAQFTRIVKKQGWGVEGGDVG